MGRRGGSGWWTAAGVFAVAAVGLLAVLRPLSFDLPAGEIDDAWTAVMGEAATWPAHWGVDLVFTYGPASALATRYFTDGYLWGVPPLLAGIALVNAFAILLLVRGAVAGRRRGAPLAVAAVAAEVAGLVTQGMFVQDGFFLAVAFAVLLLDLVRRPGERAAAVTVLSGAALLGALALVKTSFAVAVLGVLALADARALLARRRPPSLAPAALLGALATYLGHGQRLGDLPAYLGMQWQAAAGYGEAMYLAPDRFELGAFLGWAAALVLVAWRFGAPGRAGRLAAAAGTAFMLAVGLKAGFVRADTHTQIAWSLLGLMGLAVAAGLVLPRSTGGAGALGVASLAVLWVAGPLLFLRADGRPATPAGLVSLYGGVGRLIAAEADAWGHALADPAGFDASARAAKARAWAAIRAAQPLPKLAGGVDILPSAQAAVLANGLDYRPRPSFAAYSTYTAALIAANAAFYAGPHAPEWVIFGPDELDDRDPNMTEGALWPELLRRYEPQRRAGDGLALRRRAVPLPDVLGAPRRVAARLDEPVALPDAGPLFARIAVRETPLGRLAALVFRPPALALRLTTPGGREASYRFIPAVGEGGFLLSPVPADPMAFATLAFGHGAEMGGAPVSAFAVGGSPWARLFYERAVSVELRPVAVPAAEPSPDARALADEVARALPWRRLARAIGGGAPLDGDRLSAPAPTALTVPVAGARRLRVGFGIADGAWREGATEGVCFAVEGGADAAPLWRRCLDPKAVPADRGPQAAEVEVPAGLAAVTAETTCPKRCDWGWSYWSGIAPEG